MPDTPAKLPDFVSWPSFPFEGDLRVKPLEPIADHEPPRQGEDAGSCLACSAPDEAYIWVSERWRVRAMDRPTGLPMVLILESRSHLDLGDLPNLLAAELGVMTVRLERAIRSLDGVARVHVNRWGDGSAHLHLWFLARPLGRLQLRGSFLSLWDEILPPISEPQWRENLALVAAWLAEFGGRPLAEPPRIEWQAPSTFKSEIVADTPGPSGPEIVSSAEGSGATPAEDRSGEARVLPGAAPGDTASTEGAGVATGSEAAPRNRPTPGIPKPVVPSTVPSPGNPPTPGPHPAASPAVS
ncbi:hypothetical protein GCM10023322_41150 [Rugosimonospora acidiphila]|uniref:Diadenosine tetraphosphate (Ap4A) hydrolase n=1 Tax=Rugosimonospora acidiphila TaxID=556531 RepID=A0ABP9S0M5_9ACTN